MKKNGAFVLAVLLAATLLLGCIAAQAETELKPGYTVNESKAPLFTELTSETYDVSAVTEYDREHFVLFSDPETGFWGLGLKKEYCPVGAEALPFSYENTAEILLKNADYSSVLGDYFDVKITLDKITYEMLPGAEVNGEADALGVFGFSRDMETIGFLSGWGVRALRDENGEIICSGEVWSVEDDEAYDTALLCTQVEFTVTPVFANGAPIPREKMNGFFWTVADLDTAQADVVASGEDSETYGPRWFDVSLQLVDGLNSAYTVQEGHYLEFRGEEYENDRITFAGVLTGDDHAASIQPAKQFTSIVLSQKDEKARAIWRGCGRGYAPARTELIFSAGPEEDNEAPAQMTKYIVRYLEQGTDKQLADPKNVNNQPVGASVTENAISIENYDLVGDVSQSKTLDRDADKNVIRFYYKRALSDYEVQYLEEGTEKQLADPKVVKDQPVGDSVTESAIGITNYDLVSEDPQNLLISRNADKNVIYFYYHELPIHYSVKYILRDANQEFVKELGSKDDIEAYKNDPINECPQDFEADGYICDDPDEVVNRTVEDGEVIYFYYHEEASKYTLTYHIVGDAPEGPAVPQPVTDISEGSNITLAAPLYYDNDIAVYPQESYTVRYLELGTTHELSNSVTVNGLSVGTEIEETAPAFAGYNLVGNNKQSITIGPSKKTVWTFTGWCSDQACQNTITEIVSMDEDVDVFGKWDCETIEIGKNEIIFYYEEEAEVEETISYTVKYLDLATLNPIHEDKVVTGVRVGQNVIETPVPVDGYICIDTNLQWIAEVDGVVKIFIYYFMG